MPDFLENILNSEFVQNFIMIIIKVIMVFANLILAPMGAILKVIVPDLDYGLTVIADFFTQAGLYAGYILDMIMIPSEPLNIILTFWTAAMAISFTFYAMKMVVRAWGWIKGV